MIKDNELKHLHDVLLNVIADIDQLCVENNIEYYLMGGSALGAIRHEGFIPWDDDLDIIMTISNYRKFIDVCKLKLNSDKYTLQEGGVDWPLPFTKIRLNKTTFEEEESSVSNSGNNGIFVDVFKLDNVSNNGVFACIQYILAKIYVAYSLSVRGYRYTTVKKRVIMFLSKVLSANCIRHRVINVIERNNKTPTNYLGFYYGRTNMRNAVMKREVYGTPKRVKFESMQLPVPEQSHNYLSILFGNYMKLPPVEKRVGLHVKSIDFGEY